LVGSRRVGLLGSEAKENGKGGSRVRFRCVGGNKKMAMEKELNGSGALF